ncbi:hypothetical protein POTOM_002011 [Populus tomentosa]|uniref:Cupin type-1 domain-containing protein n=1 Tax=Populus tomentosa TaxID=118781 RepID=A0A8X8IWK2_POPTO|nr:hypothetical protein POTOM_002011 [Populus tomentosa]
MIGEVAVLLVSYFFRLCVDFHLLDFYVRSPSSLVTTDEAREMITRQQEGPIVFLGDSRAPRPSPWRKFLLLKEQDRLQHLKRVVKFQQPPNQEKQMAWSWRNLLNSVLGQENKKKNVKMANPLIHSISMIDGLTLKTTMDGSLQLMSLITSLFATLGSMMAPHVNPATTEYGIVLSGSGRIQIVFPNGTQVMNARVKAETMLSGSQDTSPSVKLQKGQVLSSSSDSQLQLARTGTALDWKGLSASIVTAQREAVILPSATAAPPDEEEQAAKFRGAKGDQELWYRNGYGF